MNLKKQLQYEWCNLIMCLHRGQVDTPHSYQQGYFIFHIPLTPISRDISSLSYTPNSYQHFAKLLNEFRSYFLLALLNYLINLELFPISFAKLLNEIRNYVLLFFNRKLDGRRIFQPTGVLVSKSN